MHRVGSRELKNRLGRYLRAVRKGRSLLVTYRGKPVAKLMPAHEETPAQLFFEAKVRKLEAEGLLRLAKRPLGRFRPVKAKGKPASRIIREDRR